VLRRLLATVPVVAAVLAIAGCGSSQPVSSPPSTVTVTAAAPAPVTAAPVATQQQVAQQPAAPAKVTMPNLKGQNGAIAQDALKQLGLTNIRLAADPASGKSTVLLPENWTVTKVEPAAGTQVSTSQLIVLTMTK